MLNFKDYNPLEGKQLQIMDEKGNLNESLRPAELTDELLIDIYKKMTLLREMDKKAASLQRQGRMGVFASSYGQEASVIASSMAMGKEDWIVPAYRQQGAIIAKNLPISNFFLYYKGNEVASRLPRESHLFPVAIPVGSQPLHAAGLGMAARLKGDQTCAIAYFGEGATSEGETLEAFNFAGVYKANTIFFCENNQWAISTPRLRQTAAKTIAQKGVAFGFDGIQVDGNDPFAVFAATLAARKRAAEGEGPTLIESFTYRLGDHTSADSAKKYRDPAEVEPWHDKEPLLRTRLYLTQKGLWDDQKEEDLANEVYNQVGIAVAEAEKTPNQTIDDIFDYTFAELTPTLQEQKSYLKQFYPET
ncbi:pyruvate dehydrogenase (acetyl-transferring) E1 component subunit alpha [Patescibacteria group bacterium]|nr:pyruvate dehydrogenase (acetyl-transferring) E1 component subunit alpha [Patescibacteria group bacterium]